MGKVADRVQVTSSTTGTGSYTLGSATTGFRTFASVFADGDVVEYCANDGTNWEVGYGTLSSTRTVLSRTVRASSSGSPISWSATITIWCNFPAALASNTIPIGGLLDFAGTTAPAGFLGCDGSAVSRTTYADLYAAIGTTWGVGDGSTTFNVPDFRRRAAVGSGGTGSGTLANSVGSTGGEETHVLTSTEMPAHSHDTTVGAQMATQIANLVSVAYLTGAASGNLTTSTGGGGAHNNIQPSAVVLKIIKY